MELGARSLTLTVAWLTNICYLRPVINCSWILGLYLQNKVGPIWELRPLGVKHMTECGELPGEDMREW